ncbi:MAG TPA: flagellar motor protein MotB [Acetivibrio sp.]|uniref:OmpA/MotB family protein n=1 Tax=Acetivibrio sp. TaxID=1872092 RepID=UPI002BFCD6D6|nr:flagellar motor protein MotB [Acetivibrio sp.]HOM03186.1 flagellar motor protein MotB [Acetivibrio sp.]
MKKLRRQLEDDPPSEGAPEWLQTYSDMVTLVLTFFVLLFSMSTVSEEKFKQITNSLSAAFMGTGSGGIYGYNDGTLVYNVKENNVTGDILEDGDEAFNEGKSAEIGAFTGGNAEAEAQKIEDFIDEVQNLVEEMDLDEYVKIIDENENLTVRINSVILFDLGKADIKETGKETLKKIGALIKELNKNAIVQGHTDNLPINTMLFPTNWELSTKRATNVVLFLVEECGVDPVKMTATGNGEFRPIAPNDTEENRQKNRRIDIVIDK